MMKSENIVSLLVAGTIALGVGLAIFHGFAVGLTVVGGLLVAYGCAGAFARFVISARDDDMGGD
jgi:hypothetical protein